MSIMIRLFTVVIGLGLGSSAFAADTSPKPLPYDAEKASEASRLADPDQATQSYLQAMPADPRAKSKNYGLGGHALDIVDIEITALFLFAFMGLGWSARLRDWAARATRFSALRAALYGIVLVLLFSVVSFPLSFYRSYVRQTQFGLLSQSVGEWFKDALIGLAVAIVMTAILTAILYAVLARTPRTWWLWGSAVVIGFAIVSIALGPVFITPLFNKFTPLPSSPLKDKILTLAKEKGVPANDVLVMDASRRTQMIGAYVAGALGTTRIVLF
jgi:STE24 endopeptidase